MSADTRKANQMFISYRRRDSAGITGRIYDRLTQKFGKEAIFKDVDSVPLGVDFRNHIDAEVKRCDVVLAVIGEKWLGETTEGANFSINDPKDFVRIEIESALQRNIPVIPLLVQGAIMPPEKDLPPSIQALAYRNGLVIGDDPRFHSDVDRLIKHIEVHFASLGVTGDQIEKDDAPVQPLRSRSNEGSWWSRRRIVRKVVWAGATLLILFGAGFLSGLLIQSQTTDKFYSLAVAIPIWVFGIVLTVIVWRRVK